ncbi:MAG TPA: PASTA domain-containing protein [Kofleriaceae bacterium]|nr:PASTA domain-containing protein [Kofleriaceae bacterium]
MASKTTRTFETESVTNYVVKRSGVKVPKAEVVADRIDEELALDEAVAETVVSVFPPPGSTVPRGTKVDITLAPTWNLRPGILKIHHLGMADRTFESIYQGLLASDDMRRIVSENRSSVSMSEQDRGRVLTVLRQNNVDVTAEPGRDFDSALSTLRGALTFGTRGK